MGKAKWLLHLLAIALALASLGLAAALGTSGDFSWKATEMKRLTNCAGTAWYNKDKVGREITDCTNDPFWDSIHLTSATELNIEARRVAHRGDESCPPKRGFQYVKCYYIGGHHKGNPVVTISVKSYGFGGVELYADWYYL